MGNDAERMRRHRAHKRGDHSLCRPAYCEAAPRSAAVPLSSLPVTPITLRDTASDLLVDAVDAALAVAPTKPEDAGAVALARRYAALIDETAPASKYREPLAVLGRAVAVYEDPDAGKALDKIADALAAHSVASDLGPKLLAVLTALGMTTVSRGAKGGGVDVSKQLNPLDELRKRRAQRTIG